MVGSDEELSAGRDRVTVLTSVVLLLIAAAAWVSVIRSSLRGDDMMMTMPMPATAADGFAFVVGWGIMMTAMMLPSALPMISLYGATQRGAGGAPAKGVPVAGFTAVYLLLWAASGVPVYFAHTLLMHASRVRVRLWGRGDPAGGGGLPALAAQADVPPRVSEPAGLSPRPLARRAAGAALRSAGRMRCTVLVVAGRSCWCSSPPARWVSGGCSSSPPWWRPRSCYRAANGSRGPPAPRSCFSASRWLSVPIS